MRSVKMNEKTDTGTLRLMVNWWLWWIRGRQNYVAQAKYRSGQKFIYTCKEHAYHGSLEFQWFLQLQFLWWNEWIKNIHIINWIINFGYVESCVNQICFEAWPPNIFWVIRSVNGWFLSWAHFHRTWHTHETQPQTLQSRSLRWIRVSFVLLYSIGKLKLGVKKRLVILLFMNKSDTKQQIRVCFVIIWNWQVTSVEISTTLQQTMLKWASDSQLV